KQLVVLEVALLRPLDRRVGGGIGSFSSRIRAEAVDKAVGRRGEAIIVQLALEEGRANADVHRDRTEDAAILARDLVQDRVGETIALLEDIAACVRQRIVDRKDINGLAISLYQTDL